MKKAILGTVLFLGITSMASMAQENATTAESSEVNCNNFSDDIQNSADISVAMANYLLACPAVADQIIEVAISASPAEAHQTLMQTAADTNTLQPTDILLAAIAGGGDPATLSEPTAAGNSAIVPASAATAPPVIGGRNGGTGDSTNAASGN